jgi:O-antigen ligase
MKITPVRVLAVMMFLVPAVGVPSELMLQDTLKSAIVAFGTLGAALLFFWQQRNRSTPLLWHGLVWLPLALMAYALGSMVWSHTYLAGVEAIRWFLLALLLWLGLNTLTKDTVPTLLWGIHAGAVVASMWVALQFWFDLQWFPQGAAPASTFINRNFYAEYAVSALPLSFWLLASLPPSRKVLAMAASIVLCVVAILMTGTRSALVAMLVIAPVIVFIGVRYRHTTEVARWPKVLRSGVAAVFVLGIAGLGSIPTGNPALGAGTTPLGFGIARTASMAKSTEYTVGSFSIRSQMWKATARMVMANPVTGVGAGAWEVQTALYQNGNQPVETDYYTHNEYWQLLSEYGVLVGGGGLAVLLAYLLLSAQTTFRLDAADSKTAMLRAICLTGILAMLIVANAGFPLHLAGTGALFALLLGLLAASDLHLGLKGVGSFTVPWQRIFSNVGWGFCTAGLLLTIAITTQAVRAEHHIVRAIHLGNAVTQAQKLGQTPDAKLADEILQNIVAGIDINPHYRKLTPIVADKMAERGDWTNAITVWESVAASRPHIAAIWSNLAHGYAQVGKHEQAFHALHQWQRLQPQAVGMRALEVTLLEFTGQNAAARALLDTAFESRNFDFQLLTSGYALGVRSQDWPLAIRSLELRNQHWPDQAADGYFRLGKIYAEPSVNDATRALGAFRQGWALVPLQEKDNYRGQVPMPYQAQM